MKFEKICHLIIVFLFCLCLDFLTPISSRAACTGSSPKWISTADYTSVNSCVLQASPGDEITVSGNATWPSTLTITKGIKLIGTSNPTITGKRRLISWQPDATAQAAHATLEISNITFDADNATSAELQYAGLINVSTSSINHVYLVAHNNTFRNTVGTGIFIRGRCYGVASANVFDRIGIPIRNMGNDYNSWTNEAQAYGTAENFFFEDNIIQFSSTWPAGTSGWLETGQGGRIVVRYNTWDETNAAAPGEFWDIHGLQNPQISNPPTNCEGYSTMVSEYYGNKIINQVNAYRWMYHRGGWLLMFNNTLTGNTSPYNGITQYYCNSCQITGSFNQKAANTYAWKNLANGIEKPFLVSGTGSYPGCVSDPIVENSDFFNYNAGFNGETGVGCGTLAARPNTCQIGVAYWATNQSCSELTGMVGKNPTTPISGTLYKCTATNTWTAYYTPYQYPHPLRESATPKMPAAPNNLHY